MDNMLEIPKYFQSFSNKTLDSFFELITMLGEDLFFFFCGCIILLVYQ